MASVLLCEDTRLDRLVAVKRLHADQPEDVRRRFLREAKLGASLNHPNLVSVFDTATDEDSVLIVMEYVDGEALSRTLRRGLLPPARVARIASELGSALHHAHDHGVVHRDVKPGNVLLRDDGVTKLVDLGIATAAHHTQITRTGVVLGTAAYMAPEQLEGREIGPPADIYSLAAVCFEALTGVRAREGRTPMELARRISTEPPLDLRDRWPDAPAAAAELLKRAMAEDPRERPRTAGELGQGLRRALREVEEGAPTAVMRRPTGPAGSAAAGRFEARRRPPASRAARAAPPPTSERRPASRVGPGPPPTSERGRASRVAAVPPPTSPAAQAGPTAASRGGAPSRTSTARRIGRSRVVALAVVAALVLLAAATIVVALRSGGGDERPAADRAGLRDERQGATKQKREQRQRQRNRRQRAQAQAPPAPAEEPAAPPEAPPAEEPPASAPPEEPAPQEQPAASGPAEGARLNEQGFQLMNQGRYDEAIPILQQAVDSFPAGTSDLTYAYALFNLGRSLRLAGRPDEAIPILEQRLQIPNQTGVVRRELELAREAAGR
ncbi:MAG: serine/threonine protein kinase [Thermoleophilaceae bacterium]|nr:serine/threonine protein kinase [Thermoleophilaceae bacterium]